MTIEEAKRRAELYSAVANGKTIQVLISSGEWKDVKINELTCITENISFRIKPEPKYRPFKTQEECWQEMHKHPDFGWVKNKQNNSYCKISRIARYYTEERILCVGCSYTLAIAFDSFIFTDGTPFGIQED